MMNVPYLDPPWDAGRSEARVADIELGLTDPVDHSYWRHKAELRIAALEEDGDIFGLASHEERELAELKRLIASDGTQASD